MLNVSSEHSFKSKTNSYLLKREKHSERDIWKSRHRHLGISIDIDVGIGIDIAKKLFCLAKSLFLLFEVLCEENIHGEVLFKYTC